MPTYRLALTHQAERALKWIHEREPSLYPRIAQALDELEHDPHQGKALKGQLKGRYSCRVGSYRIVYVIQQHRLLVVIIDIGHRRDVYRQG